MSQTDAIQFVQSQSCFRVLLASFSSNDADLNLITFLYPPHSFAYPLPLSRTLVAALDPSANESGQPRLTLAVETPSSASPFPSPSSTFFPPPIPSSHEFANRIVNNKRY